MTTKIFIYNGIHEIYEAFIHEEPECDMINFLFNHKNKKNVSTNTQYHENVEWFRIKLTKKDIEEIKKTSWYFNHKPTSFVLNENSDIEIFSVQYMEN